jgi:hypothetical protein
MARKLAPPGFVRFAEFARIIGVSRSAVSQAVKSGRLRVYDGNGQPVGADGTRPRRSRKAVSRASVAPRTGEVPAPAMVVPDED